VPDEHTQDRPELSARIASVRKRCAELRRRVAGKKEEGAAWPLDMNADADTGGSWGRDPAGIRDE
jgi:hypothetical protein